MCHVAAPISELYWLMEPSPKVVVSCINGPESSVLSGPVAAVQVVADRARRRGLKVTRLAVDCAFHSTAMEPAASGLADWMQRFPADRLQRRVVSSVTTTTLYPGYDLRCHLMDHMTSPVRFIEAMDHVADLVDLCVEVGPGATLKGFTRAWLERPVLSLEVGAGNLRGLFHTLAALHSHGVKLDRDALLPARGLAAYRGSNGFRIAALRPVKRKLAGLGASMPGRPLKQAPLGACPSTD
jgi:enediyne polyketide synthase